MFRTKARTTKSKVSIRTCRASRHGTVQGTFVDESTEISLHNQIDIFYLVKNTIGSLQIRFFSLSCAGQSLLPQKIGAGRRAAYHRCGRTSCSFHSVNTGAKGGRHLTAAVSCRFSLILSIGADDGNMPQSANIMVFLFLRIHIF